MERFSPDVCSNSNPVMIEIALLTLALLEKNWTGNEDIMNQYAGIILNAVRAGVTKFCFSQFNGFQKKRPQFLL